MATFTEADVLECSCLHRQVVEWVRCPHSPHHMDLADAVVRLLGSTDPVTIRAVRAACGGRRLSAGAPPAEAFLTDRVPVQ
jgi:hypothetical protein